MSVYVGIDGGGTRLRAAVCDETMRVLASREVNSTANPNIIGREGAAALIQETVREILSDAGIDPAAVNGAGIGVAGVSADHAAEWLDAVMRAVLPQASIARSSDVEIALVGAHGDRYGLLILAGTGSAAYGVNRAGAAALVGGWGYLLGDEGSGFWIGLQAVRAFTRAADEGAASSAMLNTRIANALALDTPKAVIRQVYTDGAPPVAPIAALAEIVLELADAGDPECRRIISRAAESLTDLARLIRRRLAADDLPIAFAGGLLTSENALSRALCDRLGLAALPTPRYPPVIGAARLAQLYSETEPAPPALSGNENDVH